VDGTATSNTSLYLTWEGVAILLQLVFYLSLR